MARLDSLLELNGRNGLEDLIRGKTEGFPVFETAMAFESTRLDQPGGKIPMVSQSLS